MDGVVQGGAGNAHVDMDALTAGLVVSGDRQDGSNTQKPKLVKGC